MNSKFVSAAAVSGASIVWIPPGDFLLSDHVVVDDDVSVRGAGPFYSVLRGQPQVDGSHQSVGVYGKTSPSASQNVSIMDLAIEGKVISRCDSCDVNAVGGGLGSGSLIQNVWVRHTKCGFWLDGPFEDLHVLGCDIRNTNADGINLHGGISHVTIEQTRVGEWVILRPTASAK